MKRMYGLLAISVLGMFATLMPADDKAPPFHAESSIQIEMPPDDIQISFVESNEGMVLIAKCKNVSVRSQRLYLGDGKLAVMYEATIDGFFTPSGKVNSAQIELQKGDSIPYRSTKREKWGAKKGAVYLLTEGLTFVTRDE
ncbi:MAG: hypothetical protein KDB03_02460 [Planctomycetales bacterium]|nr:hypothetical protein [Planctomycetales bacterium]